MARKRSRAQRSSEQNNSLMETPTPGAEPKAEKQRGVFMILREWLDPLIFAYLLAMFIRTFVVELFKIPSGSMTPTLIGDEIAYVDYDNDGDEDLVVANYVGEGHGGKPYGFQLFEMGPNGYELGKPTPRVPALPMEAMREFYKKRHVRYDRICVNKFAFWFRPARRGDIVVFKVPRNIFSREKPIYVKRVAGLPNERVEIKGGRLWADGRRVTEPPFYEDHYYSRECGGEVFTGQTLGPTEYLMFGDNTLSSLDSRNWGPVPGPNFRGKAFFRYMPLSKMSLLD